MHCSFFLTVSVLEAPVRCTKAGDGTSREPTHPTTTVVALGFASSEISEVRKRTFFFLVSWGGMSPLGTSAANQPRMTDVWTSR
jgi:hypothetical protein